MMVAIMMAMAAVAALLMEVLLAREGCSGVVEDGRRRGRGGQIERMEERGDRERVEAKEEAA